MIPREWSLVSSVLCLRFSIHLRLSNFVHSFNLQERSRIVKECVLNNFCYTRELYKRGITLSSCPKLKNSTIIFQALKMEKKNNFFFLRQRKWETHVILFRKNDVWIFFDWHSYWQHPLKRFPFNYYNADHWFLFQQKHSRNKNTLAR